MLWQFHWEQFLIFNSVEKVLSVQNFFPRWYSPKNQLILCVFLAQIVLRILENNWNEAAEAVRHLVDNLCIKWNCFSSPYRKLWFSNFWTADFIYFFLTQAVSRGLENKQNKVEETVRHLVDNLCIKQNFLFLSL